MPIDATHHAAQTIVGGTALTVATGSYVIAPPPESLLEFSLFVVSITGIPYDLSVRDMIFILTAGIAIYTFLKNRSLKVKSQRRRQSDKAKK